MGRKASKATDNIYYMARCNAALSDEDFTSREKASLRLGIERSRLARIELDKIEPYPEEVNIMALEYHAPYLRDHYCSSICPIGLSRLNPTPEKSAVASESLERLVLQFLSSSQAISGITNQLVDISKDGAITENEYEGFHAILASMNEMSDNINSIKEWIAANPKLQAFFAEDL